MTLERTNEKIKELNHLIGQNVSKWNSPILDIIPAPTDNSFDTFIKAYQLTDSIAEAANIASNSNYDILLIFRKPSSGLFIYEWYSHFYPQQE